MAIKKTAPAQKTIVKKIAAPKKTVAKKVAAPKKTVAAKAVAPKKTVAPKVAAPKKTAAIENLKQMKVVVTIDELNQMIEKRAYELFLERGSHGNDHKDWYTAEQEVKKTTIVK